MVAGEYEVSLRFTRSSWGKEGNVWEGASSSGLRVGALVISPAKPALSLKCSAAWIFTDITFGLDKEGDLLLAPTRKAEALGAFVRRGSAIFVVAFENDGIVRINQDPIKKHEPILLDIDTHLQIGHRSWHIKSYEKPAINQKEETTKGTRTNRKSPQPKKEVSSLQKEKRNSARRQKKRAK